MSPLIVSFVVGNALQDDFSILLDGEVHLLPRNKVSDLEYSGDIAGRKCTDNSTRI